MDKVLDIQFDTRTGTLNVTGNLPLEGSLTADQLGALRSQIQSDIAAMPEERRKDVRAAADKVLASLQAHGVLGVSFATCAEGIDQALQILKPLSRATLGLAMSMSRTQRAFEMGQVNSLLSSARALLEAAKGQLQETGIQRMSDTPTDEVKA